MLVTNTLAYLWSQELTQHWQQLPTAGKKLLNPCTPHAGRWMRMGLVLNLGAAGVTCLPSQCLFEPWMLPGNSGIAHAPKEALGSWRKCFLSKRPRWRSSALGKIKVIEALRVKYKAALQLCFPTIKLPPMQRGKKEGGCENGWAGWASVHITFTEWSPGSRSLVRSPAAATQNCHLLQPRSKLFQAMPAHAWGSAAAPGMDQAKVGQNQSNCVKGKSFCHLSADDLN